MPVENASLVLIWYINKLQTHQLYTTSFWQQYKTYGIPHALLNNLLAKLMFYSTLIINEGSYNNW